MLNSCLCTLSSERSTDFPLRWWHHIAYMCHLKSFSSDMMHLTDDICDIQRRPCHNIYVVGENIRDHSTMKCRLEEMEVCATVTKNEPHRDKTNKMACAKTQISLGIRPV